MHYVDEDGDKIVLSSQSDFDEMLSDAHMYTVILRLFLFALDNLLHLNFSDKKIIIDLIFFYFLSYSPIIFIFQIFFFWQIHISESSFVSFK